jgi:hypothetical protein
MGPWVRWAILAGALGGVVVLFVALSPGRAPPSPTGSARPSTSSSATVTPSASEAPPVTEIDVAVRGGTVDAPQRPSATQGAEVLIVVRADVADEVHVHGYDLTADVAPGEPARIRFVADIAGVFDVELEDAGTVLFQLEITP